MGSRKGLDGRGRDKDGEIRHKNGNTLVGTLRQIYGSDFADGRRSDMKLENLLREKGVDSLSELIRKEKDS